MKKTITYSFSLLALILMFMSCSTQKTPLQLEQEAKAFQDLKSWVDLRSFKFNAEASYPLQTNDVVNITTALLRNTGSNGTRQNLLGRGDFIKILNDSVSAQLSYIGELRMASYNDAYDGGINFDNTVEDFETEIDDDKKEIVIKFEVNANNDQYNVVMLLFPNKKANVSIFGARRSAIKYTGSIEALEKSSNK